MGTRFLDSILSLLTAACVVFAAYFVGHALSIDHGAWAWIAAAVLLGLGMGLGLFTIRRIRSYGRRSDDHTHSHVH